jgi:hypothetical protein
MYKKCYFQKSNQLHAVCLATYTTVSLSIVSDSNVWSTVNPPRQQNSELNHEIPFKKTEI